MPASENFMGSKKSVSDSSIKSNTDIQFVFNGNTKFREEDDSEKKDHPLQNVKLTELANKFESVLYKVKKLELHHLVEPIQSVAVKLRQLDEIAEELACDYYDDYPCANKDCCNEIELKKCSKKLPLNASQTNHTRAEKERTDYNKSDESCECCNIHGVKSCHCASEDSDEDQITCKTVIPDHRKVKNSRMNDERKCAVCKCMFKTFGKRTKTLDNKLAVRKKKCKNDKTDEFTGATELPLGPGRSIDDIIIKRIISSKRIELDTDFTNINLHVNREDTIIQDTAYTKTQRKNQAILCNLSSDSSSEEYLSDHSTSDEEYFFRNRKPKGVTDQHFTTKSNVNISGCGRQVEDASGSNICPCGCGDMMDLPKGKYTQRFDCRCENCGKEITENQSPKDARTTLADTKKTNSLSDTTPDTKSQTQSKKRDSEKEDLQRDDDRVVPFEDVKVYIDDLKDQCREKDEMIMGLTKLIGECRGSDLTSPTYIS